MSGASDSKLTDYTIQRFGALFLWRDLKPRQGNGNGEWVEGGWIACFAPAEI